MSIALHAFVIGNTTLPSRDCIVFCRYALDLGDPPPAAGSALSVIKGSEHPPGYPLAILAVSQIIGNKTVPQMALSAQVASALAGVLLTIPLYYLTRRLFDRNSAFSATAVSGVLPGFVEVTSDGISDGLFWLTAVTALWFGVLAIERSNRRSATAFGLLAGLMCGLGYLVRPESAVVALSIGLTLLGVVITLARRRRRTKIPNDGIRPRFSAGLALILGWVLVTVPYMVLIGNITNKPSGMGWLKKLLGKEIDPTYFDRQGARPAPQVPLAIWWDDAVNAGESRSVWALKSLWAEYWKASFYVLPAFGVIGLFAVRRRLSDPRFTLLIVFSAIQIFLLWTLAVFIGYVSQRHTILLVLVTCIFTPAGFFALARFAINLWRTPTASRWFGPGLIRVMQNSNPVLLVAIWTAIVMIVALPRNFHSLHEERKGHKLAGLWMKDHVPKENQIVDPFGWAEWYSTRTLKAIPNPVYTPGMADFYVVFTPNANSPHSRLGTYRWAEVLTVPANREIVFRFPEGAPENEIDVAVFKCRPLPVPPLKKK
ncbi:MAG TPA: glycosyltransferase family 39 protein [Gemmataceae bacterium]|nr:glycosyltransferase family 39 protein [Gemmataceae bacterium]